MFLKKTFTTILILVLVATGADIVFAQNVDEIKKNIDSHSDKIKKLDEEIKAYEKQIQATGAEAKSLESAIKTLDINQKKITAEIQKTQTNINKSNLVIDSLSQEVGTIKNKINSNGQAIAKILNEINRADNISLIENILSNNSIADMLDQYESLGQLQEGIRVQSNELEVHKSELEDRKARTEAEKSKLVSLKSELGDQNQILANNKKEKNSLLSTTKNKESEYKKLLATRQAEKEKFEKELFDFESQLKRAIDPASFPGARKGIISYPLDNVFVTQAFGKTIEAKRLYVSGTHNGVDFRAARGTAVKSVLEGSVEGIGNTDEQRSCYSYGKWVLIKHPNGLSSLYAHLDLIKVSKGQSIKTGEIIGYSGQTGYATGPHLHLTLYASQGVEIQRYSQSRNCKNVDIPIAGSNAYLDPMLYF